MLTYLNDSFLEIDNDEVVALQRSTRALPFPIATGESLEVQAFLVQHRRGEEPCCHAAFYCRNLRRSLLFAVSGAGAVDPVRYAEAELRRLGFALDVVNLNLNPALRQVVLRDIPPLRPPRGDGDEETETAPPGTAPESLASLGDSDSAIAKSAALRGPAQRNAAKRLQLLRTALEAALAPASPPATPALPPGETAVLAEERARREEAEVVLAAAEQRIRELEAELVGAETRAAGELQLRKKLASLEKRGREPGREAREAAVLAKAAEERCAALNQALTECRQQVDRGEERLAAAAAEHAAALDANNRRQREEAARGAALDAELAGVRGRMGAVATARDELLGELKAARQRIGMLEQQLAGAVAEATARQAAAEGLAGERDQARELAGQLQAAGNKLHKELAAARKRGTTLAKKLQEAEAALAAGAAAPMPAGGDAEPAALAEALQSLQQERRERTGLEEQLDAAHRMLAALEQALTLARENGAPAGEGGTAGRQLQELAAQLGSAEVQLEQERIENRRLAKAHANAEKRLAALELALQREAVQPEAPPATAPAGKAPAGARRLPHELRPPPRPGALFRPDWELRGLPCRSADQVVRAWESVYNVQLSLEGYPSQYCAAFLVVLKQGRQKRLYLLFNLTKSRHTLVCVPAQPPEDDAALRKVLGEGQKFLKKSGFALEQLTPEQVSDTLGGYFLKG